MQLLYFAVAYSRAYTRALSCLKALRQNKHSAVYQNDYTYVSKELHLPVLITISTYSQ